MYDPNTDDLGPVEKRVPKLKAAVDCMEEMLEYYHMEGRAISLETVTEWLEATKKYLKQDEAELKAKRDKAKKLQAAFANPKGIPKRS